LSLHLQACREYIIDSIDSEEYLAATITEEGKMPTVLELTTVERERYITAGRRRAAAPHTPEDPSLRRDRTMLLERVRLVAAALKASFGARRVILFGSLAHGAWFTAHSDVDLAVDGLRKDSYWEAWRVVEQFIPDRSVDLVELDTAKPSLRQSIETDGVEL
jgi:predicted nucleotidyltransferase